MRELKQVFVCNNYFNFHVNGICSTTWSWKTLPSGGLSFEGWRIYPKHRSAKKNRQSFRLKRSIFHL